MKHFRTRGLLQPPATFFITLVLVQISFAQDTPANQSWTATSRQESPSETWNPIRTHETHTETDGRTLDETSVETMGPDGKFVPYLDIERESVRSDTTIVRSVEKTFARGPSGEKALVQERREESLSLPSGETRVVRTVSNPDANGALQVVQRELQDSKQSGPGIREADSTVFTPNPNGGFAPAVQIHEVERQGGDGTIEFKRSTWLSDGTGRWQLKEVREGVSQEDGQQKRKHEESVLRPDSNGKLEVVERTVSTQTDTGLGQDRETIESYSILVPGVAGETGLQLVQRETATGQNAVVEHSTVRQIERVTPGSTRSILHITEEAIDIVRPIGKGLVEERNTIYSMDANGQLRQVWVDLGEIDNRSATKADTIQPHISTYHAPR